MIAIHVGEGGMTESERLAAIEDIRQTKAKYWRGIDLGDRDLVRSILAEDCVLDYVGCWTDPVTGTDHMPAMNVVLRGRESWQAQLDGPPIATVHQGHQSEIELTSEMTAQGLWYFTDRFFIPAGSPLAQLVGYGRYHDTYEKSGGRWLLKTTRITRIRVETR
jgi:hypothetical protein